MPDSKEADLAYLARVPDKNRTFAVLILQELDKAQRKFAPMHSAHEGYAVILEELDELWDETKNHNPSLLRLAEESIQVAAMAIRFLIDVVSK